MPIKPPSNPSPATAPAPAPQVAVKTPNVATSATVNGQTTMPTVASAPAVPVAGLLVPEGADYVALAFVSVFRPGEKFNSVTSVPKNVTPDRVAQWLERGLIKAL